MDFLHSIGGIALNMVLDWANMGIMLGLTFGVLILLRPITNRLLKAGHRVFLWMLGWTTWIWIAYERLGQIRFLPVTFRSLVVPRTYGSRGTAPAFLPHEIEAGVEHTIAMPGGAEFPFTLEQWAVTLLSLGSVAVVVFALWWSFSGSWRMKEKYEGRWLSGEELQALGLDESKYLVQVRLCRGLPTSFVTLGRFAGAEKGTNYAIYLQEELPPERRKLVLMHEMEHIYHYHLQLKGYLSLALILFCWNPIIWVAYRLTCRDMELACDEAVMNKLDAAQRKEYARMLVDLGSGKYMWRALNCFGECDAAIRVKRAVDWKEEPEIMDGLRFLLVIAMGLFFFTGALDWTPPSYSNPKNLVEAAQDWDGDNTVWREYAGGPKLVEDLREQTGLAVLLPIQIYEVREGEAYVRDYMSREFHCIFSQDADGVWCLTDYKQLMTEKPDTEGLEYIKPWTIR